ncbi:MAG TPA: hypothetical protein VK210_16450, partial [Terriglobia bacterium]|nr:hypothetical protein [Terriglobia bacterium]
MAHFELKLKRRFIGILVLCLATTATAQIPTSFQVPVLGYLFDTESRTIRPIVGVAGSSRIDAPLALPITIESAAFLPDHRHAIVSSRDSSTLMVFDLLEIKGTPIFGARSSITSLEMSSDGKTVALYYADSRNLLIVGGLPAAPVILGSIDTSFVSATLSQFAISDDGGAALLGFS